MTLSIKCNRPERQQSTNRVQVCFVLKNYRSQSLLSLPGNEAKVRRSWLLISQSMQNTSRKEFFPPSQKIPNGHCAHTFSMKKCTYFIGIKIFFFLCGIWWTNSFNETYRFPYVVVGQRPGLQANNSQRLTTGKNVPSFCTSLSFKLTET